MILDELRIGGTASIYKAYDDELKAIVALKVFTVEGRDPDVVSEFWHRETTALSTLKHEAIVRYLGAGRDSNSNQRYLILEWVDGATLEEHLEKAGALDWERFFAAFGAPILSALTHAADRNIIHRDLTPANIMVLPTGSIRIIDFGQAKISTIPIGRTVAGWRTAPYCPPEEDSGTHTYTRDAFSFCAIAVRAIIGRKLFKHEELYLAFDSIQLPDNIRNVFMRALNREPRDRYTNTIEFCSALEGAPDADANSDRVDQAIPIRLTPSVIDRVRHPDSDDDLGLTATELLLAELNDTVAISPNDASGISANRIDLETQSYRLIADIDSTRADHLVVVHLVQKRFRLDSLYQTDRWMPRVQFTGTLPQRAEQRSIAEKAVRTLYEGIEEFQTSLTKSRRRKGGRAIDQWTRLLDALRHLARHGVPVLRYTKLERDGNRLVATIDNPEDAQEEELRTISVDGHWVFRGEIESVRGNSCVLVSTRPRIDLESIPHKGQMEIDWQQTKVALDRQARAVERFKLGATPNPNLGRLLTGEDIGATEPSFATIKSFFDKSLDAPKKEIVSRSIAGIELLVAHGPPGTGKTKLIVELIRQALEADPTCKILMVSQTHVALDNALERLLKATPDVACVRIGSGSTEIDPRVASCTVEMRGRALRMQVEAASQNFLEERAVSLGVDRSSIELGLRALDVINLRDVLTAQQQQTDRIAAELTEISQQMAERDGRSRSTTERSDNNLRSVVLEQDLDRAQGQLEITEAELESAIERLRLQGRTGRELADSTEPDLRQWADMLIENDQQKSFGELMKLAEVWRLRFGQSDDFRAAIISSSSIVAGTCVGFCREDAASRATFDLCIVDEAGKATTTELLVPLAQSRRAVIVGDHHQLPAVLDHAIRTPEFLDRFGLTEQQLDVQLFEELTKELGLGGKATLTTQYRMRGSIGSLISNCFYDGGLNTDISLSERELPDLALAGLEHAVTWLDPYTGAGKDRLEQAVGTSYSSAREVQCIVALLRRLRFVFENTLKTKQWPSVAVITGYGPQANQLRSEIRRDSSLDRIKVECATVHSFQGREVDICIYSVSRKNRDYRIGMLKDWRHLNVALSRARDFLVIVGGVDFCRNVPAPNPFSPIIRFIEISHECALKEWPDD